MSIVTNVILTTINITYSFPSIHAHELINRRHNIRWCWLPSHATSPGRGVPILLWENFWSIHYRSGRFWRLLLASSRNPGIVYSQRAGCPAPLSPVPRKSVLLSLPKYIGGAVDVGISCPAAWRSGVASRDSLPAERSRIGSPVCMAGRLIQTVVIREVVWFFRSR